MIFQKQLSYLKNLIQATRKAYQAFLEVNNQNKVTIRYRKQQLVGLSKRETFSRQVQTSWWANKLSIQSQTATSA